MSDDEFIREASPSHCPDCGIEDRRQFRLIPENRLVYESRDGAECTEYAGPARDYSCDCGASWLLWKAPIE